MGGTVAMIQCYGQNFAGSWGTWSAAALMQGYLEQTPLYNSADSSLAIGMSSARHIDSTVLHKNINHFICNLGVLSPIQPTNHTNGPTSGLNNNYLAPVGTSTNCSMTFHPNPESNAGNNNINSFRW